MILFYNIKNYIEDNNIFITFYCKEELHKQLSEFICSNNIKLGNYTQNNIGLNVWINNSDFPIHWSKWLGSKNTLNDFYVEFFNQLLEKININQKITYLSYKDEDLLTRYNKFDNKYKNIDFLIINSVPMSGQINYNEDGWNNLCEQLNKKYKIITTKKVNNIFCTLDEQLTIKDIAALSTNIKKIIAVNTGIITGLFNEYTLNNIKVLYFFDDYATYSYPKFEKVNAIEDLKFLYEDKQIEQFGNVIVNDKILIILICILILLFIL